MKVSAKTEYGCRALLELALHWPNPEPMQINTIAQKHKIPLKFLVHIMIQLKQMGYVQSSRGQKGGYILKKPPKEIVLSEVLSHFGEINDLSKNLMKKSQKQDVLQSVWQETGIALFNSLNNIDFDELVRRERSLGNVAMYTI